MDWLYIGKKACGCVVAACVDDPDDRQWTSERVAEFVRESYQIERVEGPIMLKRCTHAQVTPPERRA